MKTYIETSSILLEGIDEMIREGYFNNRTEAVNTALEEIHSSRGDARPVQAWKTANEGEKAQGWEKKRRREIKI
jgi:Arc/MetJ-type ribon-helix-helix transcriptional regulator